jgi:hypothetical protein
MRRRPVAELMPTPDGGRVEKNGALPSVHSMAQVRIGECTCSLVMQSL